MTWLAIERTAAAYGFPLLIKSILAEGLRKSPNQEIVYGSRRLTYAEMAARISRLAAALARIGVVPGKTVGVMDWDSHRFLEAFFAVPMMGAVLRHINPRLSPEQILYTINHAEDDVLLVNVDFLPIIAQIWDRVAPGKTIVLLADGATPAVSPGLPVAGEYEALLAAADATFKFPDIDENTRATTFYTTGTTGLPKGVYYSHRQLVLHTLAVRSALAESLHGRFTRHDVYMPITPMFHVHAWGMPYVATMLGVKQVYPGRYLPDHLVELLTREKVTFSHCVPTILQMLLDSPKMKDAPVNGWKVVIGGAAMPQALARRAMDLGIDVFTGYGMSETCPILSLSHLSDDMLLLDRDEQAKILCRTGRPIDLVELRIVDAGMNDVPHDGVAQGEIVVRAPWLTQGYLKDPVASAKLWEGGWLHTGDVAVIGPDGYVRITDRIKDVIKTGGEWVSSLEVEDLILKCPGVAEAAVIGVPDPRWTERPMALVVPRKDNPATEESIRAFLSDFAAKGIISKYAVPERVKLVPELQKTSVGKLNKKLMREDYEKSAK